MKLKRQIIPVICFFVLMLMGIKVFAIYLPETQTEEKNLAELKWSLWGYRPNVWRMNFDFDRLTGSWAEYQNIPITIPGSVQKALKDENIIPDWNFGLNFTQAEWIENRHWLIAAKIPDEWVSEKEDWILVCKGLDYNGIVFVNGKEAGRFDNAFVPWSFDIAPFLKEQNNTLVFVFECPPNYQGQIGYTSRVTDWKPRFYYGWDWIPRIVQVGIWDELLLQTKSQNAFAGKIKISTKAKKDENKGELSVIVPGAGIHHDGYAVILLRKLSGEQVLTDTFSLGEISEGKSWDNLSVKRWYPNGWGKPELYLLKLTFYTENGQVISVKEQKVGFKHVEWLPNKGAPGDAEPWICSINNQPIFIQGVNWTPLLPDFADLKKTEYKKILTTYQNLGINTIRVWGGGFAEKSWLYEFCDELGILVWQDFPLSSSGLDNYPPPEPQVIAEFSEIAEHYVTRLKGHVSLLLWCGGNELYEIGDTRPVNASHPLIAEIQAVVEENDPDRRFVPGTPSGPSIYANPDNFGKGIHWDTHGPWKLPFGKQKSMDEVRDFWKNNDSFFCSEVGVPGAMSASLIEKYSGEFSPLPANLDNPLWRTVNWWNEWSEFLSEASESERTLENYVRWSQNRQAEGLEIALKASKEKFPACGGFLIWMGHDCFPCPVNTSIIDFEGNPKPAAGRLSKIWKNNGTIINSYRK